MLAVLVRAMATSTASGSRPSARPWRGRVGQALASEVGVRDLGEGLGFSQLNPKPFRQALERKGWARGWFLK